MLVVSDETFGPVLAICRIEGPAEAVRRINRSRYGLGTSIWTSDIKRAERLAQRLQVGVVTVNNHSLTGAIPDLPWSGTRQTGHGIANSIYSLSNFAQPKTVLIDRSNNPEPYWLPYNPETLELGQLVADMQLRKIDKIWKVPLLIRSRMKALKSFFR